MDNVATQICSQCQQVKELTTANFGVNTDSKTGFRSTCKICYASNRNKKSSPEEKRLKMHTKIVAEAKRRLAHPETLTPGELSKLEVIVRLENERLEKLAAKVDEQRKEAERAKELAVTGPSLDRVRAMGNELFGADGNWLSVSERPAQLARLKAALENLNGPADDAARAYLQTSIQALEKMLANAAEREAFLAQQEQETANGSACQDAADAIHDKFAGLFGEGVSAVERDKLKTLFQIVREEAQQKHKTIKPDEMTATGANRKVVSSRILEELTAIAGRLGKAGIEVGPGQSLENAQSLEWSQQLSARDMRAYVRQLTAKLEAARATMTPEEYKKKYLELPVAPKEEIVVWCVRLLDGREEWMWPSGKIVRRGTDIGSSEIVKDALHGWVIAPSPAGAELDDENKPVGKLECVQEDNGQFVYKVVDPDERWEQGNDGLWTKVAGSDSPWSKPEKITFKVGPAQPDAAHSEFRLGNWFTPAECAAADHAPDLETSPVILPPLKRTKADSIAVEPPPNAIQLERMNRPAESPWQRHERKQREEKEREAALLKGTYIWDKTQALTGDAHGR
ncbi:MAG: hypothetical protein WCB00_13870 [Candidatus Acidiferrales bacterium]